MINFSLMLLGYILHVAVWNSNSIPTSEDGIELPIYPSSYFFYFFSFKEKICLIFWAICIACRLYQAQNISLLFWPISLALPAEAEATQHFRAISTRQLALLSFINPIFAWHCHFVSYPADRLVAFSFINPIVLL